MKGWKIVEPLQLKEEEIIDTPDSACFSKVKITKALITLADVLRYNGDIDCENVVLGSSGIGVISETEANLFGFEKGKHVYIDPTRACGACHVCKVATLRNAPPLKQLVKILMGSWEILQRLMQINFSFYLIAFKI